MAYFYAYLPLNYFLGFFLCVYVFFIEHAALGVLALSLRDQLPRLLTFIESSMQACQFPRHNAVLSLKISPWWSVVVL